MGTTNKACGVQQVVEAKNVTRQGERLRWRCELACGHTVYRRQDKPPQTACCERRERHQQPPTPYEERAQRAILAACVAASDGSVNGIDLREAVIGGHVVERVYEMARRRLGAEGLIETQGQRTRITEAGRAEHARRAAA